MDSSKARVALLLSGIVAAIATTAEVLCRLSAGERPSLNDGAALIDYFTQHEVPLLLAVVADTLLMAALVVFFVVLRIVINGRSHAFRWATDVGLASLLVYVLITLLGDSMDGGTVLNTTLSQGDPVVIRVLIESHILLFGPIGSVFIVLTLIAYGYALLSSRIASRWIGYAAIGVAAANILAIPMVFRQIGSGVYGTQVTLGALGLFILWVTITGVTMGRRRVVVIP